MVDRMTETYRGAGVDLDAAERAKTRLKELVASTRDRFTLSELGSFGGLYAVSGDAREPVLVARSSEIPAGHFLTRELLVPLLLTRDEHGRLRGFLNVCKHRGTQLVDAPSGKNRVFVCPYHAWAYNPDGQLRGIPHGYGFDGIDRGCLNLTEVPVAERFCTWKE